MPTFTAVCHPDHFYLLPSICIMQTRCEDPRCECVYHAIAFDWLIFGAAISF